MTEQKCVRTYDIANYTLSSSACTDDLNYYLARGWKVIRVTPKEKYNEYIVEREIEEEKEP